MNTGTTEEIRRSLEDATPGPWKIDEANNVNGPDTGYGEMRVATLYGTARREQTDNAHLIANAPTWLRSLLEENKQLQEALTENVAKKTGAYESLEEWQGIVQSLRSELAAKDKVLEWYAGHRFDDGEKARSIIKQYAINESKPDTATTSLG